MNNVILFPRKRIKRPFEKDEKKIFKIFFETYAEFIMKDWKILHKIFSLCSGSRRHVPSRNIMDNPV
ncbi:MAG: hypothetical protein DRG83_11460 [Deltaproteobacteria bacterium]|nr:MAG: hypothetical protein DRG83_11460 [Deltaproteobacteria bacterium]